MKGKRTPEQQEKCEFAKNSDNYRAYDVLNMITQLNISYKRYAILIQEGQFEYMTSFLARLNESWKCFRYLLSRGLRKTKGIDEKIRDLRIRIKNSLEDLREFKKLGDLEARNQIMDDLWGLWDELEDLQGVIEQEQFERGLDLTYVTRDRVRDRLGDIAGNDADEVNKFLKGIGVE